jgi:hypothetical protein
MNNASGIPEYTLDSLSEEEADLLEGIGIPAGSTPEADDVAVPGLVLFAPPQVAL